MTKKKKSYVNLAHARTDNQRKRMEAIAEEGVCPFCPMHLKRFHKNPILRKSAHWLLTKNDYPYAGTRVHLLIIHRKHITLPSKLSGAALVEFTRHLNWAIKKFDIKGGSFLMRFGDMRHNAASVDHLHGHIIVGDIDEKNHEPVRVKVG